MLRRLFFTVLTFACGLAVSGHAQQIVKDSLKVQGLQRHFTMYLPDNLPEQAPLVFVLHGYGNKGDALTWMNNAAVRHKFALCIPSGLVDPNGKNSWNVGYPWQKGWKTDDVKTMCSIAKHIQKKYNLSKENTFLTGMSNGGEMCYLLAYSKQNTFKALASVAGLTMTWMYEEREIEKPIPFMEIHGTQDHISEWWGDQQNSGGWGAYMAVPLAVGRIISKNRCTDIQSDTVTADRKEAHDYIRHRYSNPKTHNDVWLYEIINGGHTWATDDMDTGEEIWSFFRRYLK